jgi:hypothetical protein
VWLYCTTVLVLGAVAQQTGRIGSQTNRVSRYLEEAKLLQNKIDEISVELTAKLAEEHEASNEIRLGLVQRRDALLQNTPNFWGVAMKRLRNQMLYIMPAEHQEAIVASSKSSKFYSVPKGEVWEMQVVDDDRIIRHMLRSVTCRKQAGYDQSHLYADEMFYNITFGFSDDPSYPFATRQLNRVFPVSFIARQQVACMNTKSEGIGIDFSEDYLFAFNLGPNTKLVPVPGSFFSIFVQDATMKQLHPTQKGLHAARVHAFVKDVCVELMHNPLDMYDRGVLEEREENFRAEEEANQLRLLLADL